MQRFKSCDKKFFPDVKLFFDEKQKTDSMFKEQKTQKYAGPFPDLFPKNNLKFMGILSPTCKKHHNN